MTDKSRELIFQNDIIESLTSNGWLIGESKHYNRELALYPEDVIGYIKETQPQQWEKFQKQYPEESETCLLKSVARQLSKVDPGASSQQMRKYGTLGVLRNEIKDRGARLKLCQFKPDHDLNPDTLMRYQKNRLRVVPELVYSPNGYDGRIDLVLFVNGIPIATLELKSEFKQPLENAKVQYQKDRLPKDPATKKPEPLLTFKRGALVHFIVSQYNVFMTTKLAGMETFFLPFNRGTKDGGAGNDTPDSGYATAYLWEEVFLPDNLLRILGRFIHLQIEEKEDIDGRKFKKETLIFPRYHQWDVVNRLIASAKQEGPGEKYLIQHSAGSGKSNSIAWTAHQLASLYYEDGSKQFHSVIVVTDRTVLDAQLQDTIYQFEHADGVVGRINREEGQGSKSSQLAQALEDAQPIIIVTIQTFPHVIDEIQKNTTLKDRNYAIIADEAHSSQTGSTARKLKEVLMSKQLEEGEELTAEELLGLTLEARKGSQNLSYFAFTATPKSKTIELFGRCPDPNLPPSDKNKPEPFHIYSMRQAIEEGFILDVLKNYISYQTALKLYLDKQELDKEVDSKKAATKVSQWVKLHPHNISQKVKVIIEHYKKNVMPLLGGQAKAMVVTGSRPEVVRYKKAFDKYITDNRYKKIRAMVAFSGEVPNEDEPEKPYTERNMNPELKGRDMRKAFDTDDYQVMLVANKFQTGFDQPKLCAMYVDKKLSGVDCVQTLSRLNRTFPGKKEVGTFVLDFVNDPDDILKDFKTYYKTAELNGVSDPNLVYDLFDKLESQNIYERHEVEALFKAFYNKHVKQDRLSNICKPAMERWKSRYKTAQADLNHANKILKRAKKSEDAVLIANADKDVKEAKSALDLLVIFKKDLGSFTRFYEFMSQVIDYDDEELEKFNLYARHLHPLLREPTDDTEEEIDLSGVTMKNYRLSKIKEQDLKLAEEKEEYGLDPITSIGSGKFRDKNTDLLSKILERLNELFPVEGRTDGDKLNFAHTIADKVRESQMIVDQVMNNSREQAMLGDIPNAIEDAVMESGDAFQSLMMHYLTDSLTKMGFDKIIYDLIKNKVGENIQGMYK